MDNSVNTGTEFCIQAGYFFVGRSTQCCWNCQRMSDVYSIMVPAGFEHLDEGRWSIEDEPSFLSNLTRLSREPYQLMQKNYPLYGPDFSKTAEDDYFMNHCQFCGAKLGDFYLHLEPGGAFFPTGREQATKVRLRRFNIRLEAIANYGGAAGEILAKFARPLEPQEFPPLDAEEKRANEDL